MSEGDSEPAKLISIETIGDMKLVTIEVSSIKSFLHYKLHYVGELTIVRISSSCPPAERDAIIQFCNHTRNLHYESAGNVDGGGSQPPQGGNQGESSGAGQGKEEEEAKEDEKKA